MGKNVELIKEGVRTNLGVLCEKAYCELYSEQVFKDLRNSASDPSGFLGGPVYGWIDMQLAIERAFRAGFNAAKSPG